VKQFIVHESDRRVGNKNAVIHLDSRKLLLKNRLLPVLTFESQIRIILKYIVLHHITSLVDSSVLSAVIKKCLNPV